MEVFGLIALLQRVSSAHVRVGETLISSIGSGVLLFVAVTRGDQEEHASWLAKKIVNHRIFPGNGRPMDLSIADISGEILIVSQFTLAAVTSRGNRPDFSDAELPDRAMQLYEFFVEKIRDFHDPDKVSVGEFGADMQVSLINDGPVTILLSRGGSS